MVWDEKQELTQLDRDLIGGAKRITIPLHNKILLRDVADALRGLATTMDLNSRMVETSERDALLRVKHEIDHTNRLIKDACRRHDVELRDGRPPDSKRLAAGVNTRRTDGSVITPVLQYVAKRNQ